MKVQRLLEQNDLSFVSHSIANNFGDQYLCKFNSIFREIRENSIKFGFSFSAGQNEYYQALPLSQLEAILKNKKLPFNDNVTVVKSLQNQMQNLLEWNDICDNLIKNHIFHESCHAVARTISNSIFQGFDGFHSDSREQVLRLLIEESFANSCELLAVIEAQDQVHRIFFEWNSYICMFEDRGNLKNAVNDLGFQDVFKYFLFTYLHSNFLKDPLQDHEYELIFKYVFRNIQLTSQSKKSLKAISKIAFKLNPRFREVTTGFYLKMLGAKGTLQQNLNFNFMEYFESDSRFIKFIEQLMGVIPKNLRL